MNRLGYLLLFISITFFACDKNVNEENSIDIDLVKSIRDHTPNHDESYFIFPNPKILSKIPNQDPRNKLTKEKVELGKLLYFETGLAQNPKNDICKETYSCASCHVVSKGFTPGAMQGIADGGIGFGTSGEGRTLMNSYAANDADVQGIRPLSMLNLAYVTNTFWNGEFGAKGVNIGTEDVWAQENDRTEVNKLGYVGLESQNIEGLPLHRMLINDKVLDEFGYRAYFDKAFPQWDESKRYSSQAAAFAISAYLRTLMTTDAPFQKFLKGDKDAMTMAQKKGADLFFGKARCINCHDGTSFNSMNFYRIGTADMYASGGIATTPYDKKNLGRGGFTGNEDELYAFKVPQLYNVGDYATLFHGSSKRSVREVVEYKVAARSENPRVSNDELADYFQPINNMTATDIDNLVDFLENGLRDPNLTRYVPESVLSGNCFPNNDVVSKQQMGCE